MKTATFVTLLVLFVSIFVPLFVTTAPSASFALVITNDICDSVDGACFSDADHPLLQPGCCTVSCPCCAGSAGAPGLAYRQFVIPALKDQPPEG